MEFQNQKEKNVFEALIDAKNILSKMLSMGLSDSKLIFGVSTLLVKKFSLTRDEALIVIEQAIKLV